MFLQVPQSLTYQIRDPGTGIPASRADIEQFFETVQQAMSALRAGIIVQITITKIGRVTLLVVRKIGENLYGPRRPVVTDLRRGAIGCLRLLRHYQLDGLIDLIVVSAAFILARTL